MSELAEYEKSVHFDYEKARTRKETLNEAVDLVREFGDSDIIRIASMSGGCKEVGIVGMTSIQKIKAVHDALVEERVRYLKKLYS